MPYFAGKKRYPSEIRGNKELLNEKLVLPHIVLKNTGHTITLCESEYNDLCMEYNAIGVQCSSDKTEHASPAISIFLKSPYGMVEVMHHWDECKETGSKTDGWLVHGVLARCIFGPKTHDIDEGTRERVEHRYTGDDVATYAFSGED